MSFPKLGLAGKVQLWTLSNSARSFSTLRPTMKTLCLGICLEKTCKVANPTANRGSYKDGRDGVDVVGQYCVHRKDL